MQVVVAGEVDPQALQQLTVLRRKEVQRQRVGEYEEAVLSLKSKVRDAEGQAMRETVQDKVRLTPTADEDSHSLCAIMAG